MFLFYEPVSEHNCSSVPKNGKKNLWSVIFVLLHLNVCKTPNLSIHLKRNVACVQGSPNGTIGNFTNGTIGSQWCHRLTFRTNGTIGRANGTIGALPLVPMALPMVPLVETLNDIGIPLVPLVEP